MESVLTTKEITSAAFKSRSDFKHIYNNCGEIADRLEAYLIDDYGLPYGKEFAELYGRREVRVGRNGEEKHYVFEIHGEIIKEFQDGQVYWVDASFDQFCNKNKSLERTSVSYGSQSDIDSVRILSPTDARRKTQYLTIAEYMSEL